MDVFQIIQIIVAILLIIAILLQHRGVGLSEVFGGSGSVYRTRRGLERKLFIITIVLAILFFLIALFSLIS